MKNKLLKTIVILLGAIFVFPHSSYARELSDMDTILSAHTISIFLQAAECLSIKLNKKEKIDIITAHKFQASFKNTEDAMMNFELMDKWEKMWESDSKDIHQAVKKYCPYTSSLIASVLDKTSRDQRVMMLGVLEDTITAVIASQILNKDTRHKIFLYEHTPIGLEVSPY